MKVYEIFMKTMDEKMTIFVSFCTICRLPIAIIGADKEPQSIPEISRENIKAKLNTEIQPKNLNKIADMFKNFSFAKMPLCPSCLSNCIREISIYSSLLLESSTRLERILNQAPVSVVKYNIERFISEKRENPQIISPHPIEEIKEKEKPCEVHMSNFKKSQKEIEIFDPNLIFRSRQSSLLSITCFYIGKYGHYGVINGCPIGSFPYKPNSISQTNVGLTFIAHLLKHMMGLIIIPNYEIVFKPMPVIVTRGVEYVLQLPEKCKNKKMADEVNKMNDVLFSLCSEIILIGEEIGYDAYPPPFKIKTEKRMIDIISYKYNPNDLTNWSIAMKLLLTDLKAEQFRSLRKFLGINC